MSVPQELEETLNVGHGRVRCPAERHDLPEEDAEGPNVRLARVDTLEESLRSHPLDGQPAVRRLAVVLVHVHVSGEAKVGDLEDAVLAYEHIPGGQVPMNALRQSINQSIN